MARTVYLNSPGPATDLRRPVANSALPDDHQHVGINGASVTASFTYDAFTRRRSKVVNGTSTQFLYDGPNPVQEIGAGTTANLLTGLGVDEYFTRSDTGGTHALLTDALGSTMAAADETGALSTQYTYEPFGTSTATGGPDPNALQYTGRENDGTGLYYYRARYYHPGLQRFIAEDPIGSSGATRISTHTSGIRRSILSTRWVLI